MAPRVRIFIDFWSLRITWNEYHQRRGVRRQVRIPWHPRLYEVLVRTVAEGAVYAGTHVYASYALGMGKDSGLRRFFNVMDGFTGYDVFLKERAPVSPRAAPIRSAVSSSPSARTATGRSSGRWRRGSTPRWPPT